MKYPTLLNHPPVVDVPDDNHPLVAPIHQSVKFEFETLDETQRFLRGERPGFFYQRTSNPTLRQLELTLAAVQGREECIVCASGVGAMSAAMLSLCKAGDHLLCFAETYGPTRAMARRMLGKYGVRHTVLSVEDTDGIERVLAAGDVRLLAIESPTNPMNKIVDLRWLCALAHAHGALVLLDNTLAGMHQHGEFEIDLYVHSLTKHVSGHGDAMGGAVIGSATLIERLRADFTLLGGTLDPHCAFLLQRGLKTYGLRYSAQSAAALKIAEWLERNAAVSRVCYAGLASHPQRELARAQQHEFGCLISFDLKAGAEAGRQFCDALRLFANAASFGSTESLVQPPQLLAPRDLTGELLQRAGIGAGTVRLSIGLEDVDELIADLTQALAAAGA